MPTAYVDGCSYNRMGNLQAGAGVVWFNNPCPPQQLKLGPQSSLYAEIAAILITLQLAASHNIKELLICTDSNYTRCYVPAGVLSSLSLSLFLSLPVIFLGSTPWDCYWLRRLSIFINSSDVMAFAANPGHRQSFKKTSRQTLSRGNCGFLLCSSDC